jgi:hypothetical protein
VYRHRALLKTSRLVCKPGIFCASVLTNLSSLRSDARKNPVFDSAGRFLEAPICLQSYDFAPTPPKEAGMRQNTFKNLETA